MSAQMQDAQAKHDGEQGRHDTRTSPSGSEQNPIRQCDAAGIDAEPEEGRRSEGGIAGKAADDIPGGGKGDVHRDRRAEPQQVIVAAHPQRREQGRCRRGDKLPKIGINEAFGSDDFNRAVDAAIVDEIGKFGDATDWIRAEKQTREKRPPLPTTPPVPGPALVLNPL